MGGGFAPPLIWGNMPLHEFRCKTCDAITEDYFPSHDGIADIIECAKCGQPAVRIMSSCKAKIYSLDIANFGTPQYAEARAKQCGVEI